MRSVRHVANRALRAQRRKARRESGVRPPWPSLRGRLRWSAAARNPGIWGQVAALSFFVVTFTGVSVLVPGKRGIGAATTSSLSVLWQVQATSVGLVLALVVFVFGLLPQGRGRLTYREFLRRTGALPLTTFNVASLLFNGMVLLGTGHQIPRSGTTPGHGWAVTVASVVALASIGTIVLVLARALRAINPETEAEVQREHQRAAVALAARGELVELESLRIMTAETWPCKFIVTYPGPGLTISVAGPGEGVVRDVSVWRLRLLQRVTSRRNRSEPVVRAWPGKPVRAGTPLMTIDPSSSWLGRWWARRCVRVRIIGSDQLGSALTALHGETLEQIRAGRPTEAIDGMRALSSLQELLWQAYAAHGRAYGPEADRPVLYRQRAGERIGALLDDLLRAAAVSADDAVRREASDLPSVVAVDAVYREAADTVLQFMQQLEGVYIAVAGALSEGGRRDLPLTGLARSRLHAPFKSLLGFVNYALAQAIDQAAAGGTTGWGGRPLPRVEFLLAQLRAANEVMLRMLRRALQFRDSATVRRVLDAWKMPDLPLAQNAIQQAAGSDPVSAGRTVALGRALEQAIEAAQADLDAMILRLLVAAVNADRAARQSASPSWASGGGSTDRNDDVAGPDPATAAILERLPSGRFWDILETALKTSDGDWAWQLFPDDEIISAGVVAARPIDTISPLIEAFVLAAIARPELTAGTAPDRRLALDRGAELITAVDQALLNQLPWLLRHDGTQETIERQAGELRARLEKAVQDADRELEEEIRRNPVRPSALDKLRQAASVGFQRHDITTVLFDWAGRLGSGTGPQSVEASLIAPRSGFTVTEGEEMMNIYGEQLGLRLAVSSLAQLMVTASREALKSTAHVQDAAVAVRDAIAQLSDNLPAWERPHLLHAKTAVFVPDTLYGLWRDLGIASAPQDSELVAAHSQVIRELAIEDDVLASQVLGTVNGALAIRASVLSGQVLVIDLARFGKMRRNPSGGAHPTEPTLTLIEPDDPLRPSAANAATADHPGGNQPGLLQVQVTLSLPTAIEVEDASAARAIRIV
jgi:hypothetical protein